MSVAKDERGRSWGRRAVVAAAVVLSSVVVVPRAAATSSSLSEFRPCEPNPAAWCATLSVPERWDAAATTGMVHLNVVKRAATGPGGATKGVLLADAGGPRGGSAGALRGSWYEQFTKRVRDAFDIVAIDERESGIVCQGPQLSAALPLAPEVGTFDALVADNVRYAASCRPAALKTIDSLDRARDLDALRRGLGVDAVGFFGVSYGTVTGQALAELFPGTIRAMVLDSPQYPRLSTQDYLVTAAAGAEDVARGFAGWCAAHQDDQPEQGSCRSLARVIGTGRVTAERVVVHLRRLLTLAEAGVLVDDRGGTVTADALSAAFFGLLHPQDLPFHLGERADALAGLRARQREDVANRLVAEPESDTQTLLRCNDFYDRSVTTYGQWLSLWHRGRAVAPTVRTSSWHWTWMRACVGTDLGRWRPLPFPVAVPLLVTSMRYDSVTPWTWARRLASDASAPLITYDGFGHGAYDATIWYEPGRHCVAHPVEGFLLDGVEPADTRCQGATAVPGS